MSELFFWNAAVTYLIGLLFAMWFTCKFIRGSVPEDKSSRWIGLIVIGIFAVSSAVIFLQFIVPSEISLRLAFGALGVGCLLMALPGMIPAHDEPWMTKAVLIIYWLNFSVIGLATGVSVE